MTDDLDQLVAEAESLLPVVTANGKHPELAGERDDPQLQVDIRYDLLCRRLLTPDQLDTLPEPVELIEGYCTLDSLMTIIGRPGTAKTLMAMGMSFSVVTGEPWFGHTVRQGRVLYVVGEGTAGLAQRQRAWREACGWPVLAGMSWLPMAVNLLDVTTVSALVMLVQEIDPLLVVIDTVARSMPGGDENSSTDMGALVAASDRVREASHCTVCLVHHTPREGTTPRGHSALEGAVDTALLLERSGDRITLSSQKQKDLPSPEPMTFELAPIGSSVVPIEVSRGRETSDELVESERLVRQAVWDNCETDGLPATTLLELSGVPKPSFYRALKSLHAKGIIRNVGSEKRARWVAVEEPCVSQSHGVSRKSHGPVASLVSHPPLLGGET